MKTAKQKQQNFTVKQRKNWRKQIENSLIEQRIIINFWVDLDKVRGNARNPPFDSIYF